MKTQRTYIALFCLRLIFGVCTTLFASTLPAQAQYESSAEKETSKKGDYAYEDKGQLGKTTIKIGTSFPASFLKYGGDLIVPPSGVYVDYGVDKDWTIGGYLGYSQANFPVSLFAGEDLGISQNEFERLYKDKDITVAASYIIAGLRSTWWLKLSKEFSLYGAGMVFYYQDFTVNTGSDAFLFDEAGVDYRGNGVWFDICVGAKYSLTKNLGVSLEVGYGLAIAKVALGYSF